MKLFGGLTPLAKRTEVVKLESHQRLNPVFENDLNAPHLGGEFSLYFDFGAGYKRIPCRRDFVVNLDKRSGVFLHALTPKTTPSIIPPQKIMLVGFSDAGIPVSRIIFLRLETECTLLLPDGDGLAQVLVKFKYETLKTVFAESKGVRPVRPDDQLKAMAGEPKQKEAATRRFIKRFRNWRFRRKYYTVPAALDRLTSQLVASNAQMTSLMRSTIAQKENPDRTFELLERILKTK